MRESRVFLVACLGLLCGCSQPGASQVEIKNNTGVPLVGVEVDVGGREIQVGLVDAGHVARVKFDPVSDSGLRIRYRKGSGSIPLFCTGDVYVTTGLRQHVLASIGPGEDCRVEEK